MKTEKKLLSGIIFVLINLISPWFWVCLRHPANWVIRSQDLYQVQSPARISEINNLRGEAERAGWGIAGKLLVNKLTWTTKEAFSRMTETLDPDYLFFEGDLNINRSTRRSGPVYLFTLPLALAGFIGLKNKRKALLWGGIFLLPSGLIEPHYFTPIKLGFILWWNFLAAWGILRFGQWKTRPGIKWVLGAAAMFEMTNFIHDFLLHYPWRSQ